MRLKVLVYREVVYSCRAWETCAYLLVDLEVLHRTKLTDKRSICQFAVRDWRLEICCRMPDNVGGQRTLTLWGNWGWSSHSRANRGRDVAETPALVGGDRRLSGSINSRTNGSYLSLSSFLRFSTSLSVIWCQFSKLVTRRYILNDLITLSFLKVAK